MRDLAEEVDAVAEARPGDHVAQAGLLGPRADQPLSDERVNAV